MGAVTLLAGILLSGVGLVLCQSRGSVASFNHQRTSTILEPDTGCSYIAFNGRLYNKEVLMSDIPLADNLSFVRSTNTLFFSHLVPGCRVTEDALCLPHYTNAYLDIDKKELSHIAGLDNGKATLVDPETDDVYLGWENGVYKFNPATKSAEYVTGRGEHVYSLFYFKQIFYTSMPYYHLRNSQDRYANDITNSASFGYAEQNTVRRLAGNDEEYFMTNSTGLYRVPADTLSRGELYTLPEKTSLSSLKFSTDLNGKIYAFGSGAVFVPNRENKTLDKVADIERLNGLTFDEDNNIIYSNLLEIIRLKPCMKNFIRDS